MISSLAYYLILGKPLIFYLGIATFLSLLLTASIGYFSVRGIRWLPFKYHTKAAVITLILGTLHGLLAISSYFGI